jgi:hypothetical protein
MHGKQTVLLFGNYKVSANGKNYDLDFADHAVNEVDDPDNVGIYTLGVAPYKEYDLFHSVGRGLCPAHRRCHAGLAILAGEGGTCTAEGGCARSTAVGFR